MNYPKVSIIILNWNGREDTIECLESLTNITYPNHEVLLVDNGSIDGSVECLREKYPYIEIIENGNNLGFAEGNNVGIRKAVEGGTDYVLLLNNDTVVDPKFLEELVKVAESDLKVGFAGPKIYYYNFNGRKNIVNFAGGKFNIWTCEACHIGINQTDIGQYDRIKFVDYVEGSCILIRTEILKKIGLLDPIYFTYWEDTDWCIRSHKAGYKSIYVPSARIWHKVSASNKGNRKIYYLSRNKIILMKKNATKKQYYAFIFYTFLFDIWIKSTTYLIFNRGSGAFTSYLNGIIDGLKVSRS